MSDQAPDERIACEKLFESRFACFQRIRHGNNSRNFHAVTETGEAYFVKFAPACEIEGVVKRLGAISSPLIPALAFGGKTGKFKNGEEFIAIKWVGEGESIPPENLTKENIESLLAKYEEISAALQSIPPQTLEAWDGLEEAAVKANIEPKTIHGDFHFKNFFFRNGKLSTCFDLECLRRGLQTDDLIRIFVHALERTRFWRLGKRRAIFDNFAAMVELSKYPLASYQASIDLYVHHKTARRKAKSSCKIFFAIENFFRTRLYAALSRRLKKTSR